MIGIAGLSGVWNYVDDEFDEDGELKEPDHSAIDVMLKGAYSCVSPESSFELRYARMWPLSDCSKPAGPQTYIGRALANEPELRLD